MGVDVGVLGRRVAGCNIWDMVAGFQKGALQGVAAFNDVILREAVAAGVPVIDLRVLCREPGDYSEVSPIEPSVQGGEKIAAILVRVVTEHDFAARRTVLYA